MCTPPVVNMMLEKRCVIVYTPFRFFSFSEGFRLSRGAVSVAAISDKNTLSHFTWRVGADT